MKFQLSDLFFDSSQYCHPEPFSTAQDSLSRRMKRGKKHDASIRLSVPKLFDRGMIK